MGRIDFDRLIDRRGTGSLKWDRYAGNDIVPMWVADMDFAAPAEVMAALRQRIDHGVFGYTLAPQELAEVICQRLYLLYRWQVEPSSLVWLPGLVTGLNVACRAVGERNDGVVSPVPVYPPFLSAPGLMERRLLTVPIDDTPVGWRLDIYRLRQAAGEAKLLLFCHPHNPVGRIWSREELDEVAAVCLEQDLVVCSDEIHSDLLLDQNRPHIPFATLGPEIAARTITLMAPSKTYNIPGLGCSFAIIENESLRRRFRAAMLGIVPEVNTLGYIAALAAYRHGDAWLEALLDYLRGNRDLVEQEVATMAGVSMRHVEATYLAWLDVRSLRLLQPATFFEQEARVGLSDGAAFGAAGFVRLNFGCRRQVLAEALARMKRSLNL